MVSFLRDLLRILPGMLAAVYVGVTAALFLVFPRVVNELANLLGNMGDPIELVPALVHWIIALLINFVLLYFYVYRPLQHFRRARQARGLVVRRGQGVAFMDNESVRQQIYAAISELPDVSRTEVSVHSDLGRAEVQLNVLVSNTISGAKKKQELRREIKKVVEDKLGIGLAGEPLINIRLEPIGEEVPYAVPPEAPYTPPPGAPQAETVAPPQPAAPEPPASRFRLGGRRGEVAPEEPAREAEPDLGEQPVPELVKGFTDVHAGAPAGPPPFTRRPFELGREHPPAEPEKRPLPTEPAAAEQPADESSAAEAVEATETAEAAKTAILPKTGELPRREEQETPDEPQEAQDAGEAAQEHERPNP